MQISFILHQSEPTKPELLAPVELATTTWHLTGGGDFIETETSWRDPNPAPQGTPHKKTERSWTAFIEYADLPVANQVHIIPGTYDTDQEYPVFNNREVPRQTSHYSGYDFRPTRRFLLSLRLTIGNQTSPLSEKILLQHSSEG